MKKINHIFVPTQSKAAFKSLFPIGDYTKKDVRKIASEQGLITARKKRFSGIMFCWKSFSSCIFFKQKLKIKKEKLF